MCWSAPGFRTAVSQIEQQSEPAVPAEANDEDLRRYSVDQRQLRWRICLRQGSFSQCLGRLAMLPTK